MKKTPILTGYTDLVRIGRMRHLHEALIAPVTSFFPDTLFLLLYTHQ
jgi:hypothetical protein